MKYIGAYILNVIKLNSIWHYGHIWPIVKNLEQMTIQTSKNSGTFQHRRGTKHFWLF